MMRLNRAFREQPPGYVLFVLIGDPKGRVFCDYKDSSTQPLIFWIGIMIEHMDIVPPAGIVQMFTSLAI